MQVQLTQIQILMVTDSGSTKVGVSILKICHNWLRQAKSRLMAFGFLVHQEVSEGGGFVPQGSDLGP